MVFACCLVPLPLAANPYTDAMKLAAQKSVAMFGGNSLWRAAFAALALLGGCASSPVYERPALPVANTWPSMPSSSGEMIASQTHWRVYFEDPRLQALIAAALDNNRDLRIAAGRVQEARAQFGMARAEQLPSVSASASATFNRSLADFSGSGAVENGKRFDISAASVSYEADLWGRLAGLSEAAKSAYLSSESAQRAVQLSLIADVASAYFSLLQIDGLCELLQRNVSLRQEGLAVVQKGGELGGTSDFELQQATAALEVAIGALDSARYQRKIAANRMGFLVGEMPGRLPASKGLEDQGMDRTLVPGLPGEVLLLRPDVMAAEQRLAAAHANIGAARSAFLPKVVLTAGVGLASQGLSALFSGGAWSFQPLISMPLFDGGRLAAGVELAQARKEVAVAEYERTIQSAFREVADLFAAKESGRVQMQVALASQNSYARRFEIAQGRHRIGLTGYLEVLDAQRDLLAAQQVTVQARRFQLDVAAQLYKALGGGLAPSQLAQVE